MQLYGISVVGENSERKGNSMNFRRLSLALQVISLGALIEAGPAAQGLNKAWNSITGHGCMHAKVGISFICVQQAHAPTAAQADAALKEYVSEVLSGSIDESTVLAAVRALFVKNLSTTLKHVHIPASSQPKLGIFAGSHRGRVGLAEVGLEYYDIQSLADSYFGSSQFPGIAINKLWQNDDAAFNMLVTFLETANPDELEHFNSLIIAKSGINIASFTQQKPTATQSHLVSRVMSEPHSPVDFNKMFVNAVRNKSTNK